MKFRMDYITNSSSSSYIFALRQNNISHDKLKQIDSVLNYSENIMETTVAKDITDSMDTLQDKVSEETLDNLKDLIRDGYQIYEKDIYIMMIELKAKLSELLDDNFQLVDIYRKDVQ